MDLSIREESRGHREPPLKQGSAILVWNGCAYRVAEAGKQGACVTLSKVSFVVITSGLWSDAPEESLPGTHLRSKVRKNETDRRRQNHSRAADKHRRRSAA